MTITYISATSAAADNVGLPTFQAGDLALVFAQRTGSSTAPTVPAGWTSLGASSGNTPSGVIGYRWLQGGDSSTGAWTNATQIGVVVYRGVHTTEPFDCSRSMSYLSNPSSTTLTLQATNPSPAPYTNSVGVALAITSTAEGVKGWYTTGWTNRSASATSDYFGVAERVGGGSGGTSLVGNATSWGTVTVTLREPTTFPFVVDQDTKADVVSSNSTAWTITYPTNIAAGDLLILMVGADGDGSVESITDSTGWQHTSNVGNGTACWLSVWAKVASGSETGTFTANLFSTQQGAWRVYRIPAASWYGGTLTYGEGDGFRKTPSGSAGADANPNPPSNDPSTWGVENTLWITLAAADTSRTFSGYPANYFATTYMASGGSTGASLGVARRENATAAEDPGTFTISASDDWACETLAIRPAAATTRPPSSQAVIV